MVTLHFTDGPVLAVYQDIPPEFDHPYAGEVVEFSDDVERDCGAGTAACMVIAPNYPGDKCFIVIPRRGGRWRDYLRRHEVAHCNGWRHGE